jgi:hemin uptake protein HemP
MGVKKKTQRTNTEDRVTSTQTLYAPNKKVVCENIEHENQEYEG